MRYELHYAKLDLQGEIPCYEFQRFQDLINWIFDKYDEFTKYNMVFLMAAEGENFDEVLIGEDIGIIVEQMEVISEYLDQYKYFLQEYSSYEEAYKVALSMKETSALCYEPNEPSKLEKVLTEKYGHLYNIKAIKEN
jgi:hypothetical protein